VYVRSTTHPDGIGLFVMHIDGTGKRRVAFGPRSSPGGLAGEPAWAPEGGKIVFVRIIKRKFQLFIIHANGSRERRLTYAGESWSPDWSSLGKLVFVGIRHGVEGLFVINPDGSGLRRLARGKFQNPDWAPGGRRVAYATDGSREPVGIYIINSRTREKRLLRQDFGGAVW